MANTTNLNMVKPAGTDHALISVINSNMDIIDGAVGALPSGSTLQGEIDSANTAIGNLKGSYNVGSDTLANIQSAIYTLVGDMENGEQKNITFTISTAATPFSASTYIGELLRLSRTRFRVEVGDATYGTSKIFGRYKDGTWYWGIVAMKSGLINVVELTGTMPSSVNTLAKIADFPSGYSENSSFIVGYIARHTNNTWYSNVAAVNIMTTSGQGIRAQTSDSNFVGTAVKVYLGKLA